MNPTQAISVSRRATVSMIQRQVVRPTRRSVIIMSRFRDDTSIPEGAELHRSIDWDDFSPEQLSPKVLSAMNPATSSMLSKSSLDLDPPVEVLEDTHAWPPRSRLDAAHIKMSQDFDPEGPEVYRSRDAYEEDW